MVGSGDDESTDRSNRERLLAAVLEIYPAKPPAAYATGSPRYHAFVEEGSAEELQPLLTSRMRRVMNEFRKTADELLKKHGQTMQRWQTLYDLAVNDPGETLTSISNRTGIIGPRLVVLFDELEADGLIVRSVDDKDRRSKIIQLTALGDQTVAHLYKLMAGFRKELLSGVGRNEMLLMLDAAERMRLNVIRLNKDILMNIDADIEHNKTKTA